jgi:hypothetical protein
LENLYFSSFVSLLARNKILNDGDSSTSIFQTVKREDVLALDETAFTTDSDFLSEDVNPGIFRGELGVFFNSCDSLVRSTVHYVINLYDEKIYESIKKDNSCFLEKKLFMSLQTIMQPNKNNCPWIVVNNNEIILLKCL